MNINKSKNTLTITSSPIVAGYTYVHVIWKLTTQTDSLNPTTDEIIHEVYINALPGNSSKTLPSDGYYIVYEFYLPNTPGNYYYVGQDQSSVKHVYDPSGNIVPTTELITMNVSATNIVKVEQPIFHLYNLTDYYISLIKTKFLKNLCDCTNCGDSPDKKTLDALTMGLSLIEVLNTYLQYFESERIVEQLYKCTNMVFTPCNCND